MQITRQKDFDQFLKALWRKGMPDHLPFYEHFASPGFIAERTASQFDKLDFDDEGYWELYVDFWMGMGFDCVPMEIPLSQPKGGEGTLTEGSEAFVVIKTMEDYENFAWPNEESPIEFRHFETVAKLIPDGVKIVGGVCMGPYEWASQMLGVMGMSYLLVDCPELVDMVFSKLHRMIANAGRILAQMDCIGALRQGDDLGFKTATFLSPDQLRKWVFPVYKDLAQAAHDNGKPFILHSCGNLGEVYEDLIEYCKIDAKHSFEDTIMPVGEFKREYGKRLTPLGGLDVDVICRADEDELRKYTRKTVEECFEDGHWALGTGNSLTDYMPVEKYLICLDEGMKVTN